MFLIGMMGSGKSVTGRALAVKLNLDFIDLDEEIEKKMGMTISEIFQSKGEKFFRLQEGICLGEALKNCSKAVIATGGGIVLNPDNIRRMREKSEVVYLSGSFETLWNRVKNHSNRPLIAGKDPKKNFEYIYQERKSAYEGASNIHVPTDGLSAEEAADQVIEALKNGKKI